MGDTLELLFLSLGVFVECRSHRTSIPLMKMANQQVAKIHGPYSGSYWAQAHALTHEGFAHKTLPPCPTDFSIASDPTHRIARSVFNLRQHPGEATTAPAIYLAWLPLPQRFVWTMLIVIAQPDGGAVLLAAPRPGCRPRSLPLQHSMKLLVGSIVLGTARTRQLHPYTQTNPPRAQARQPARTSGGEGPTIVHSNHLRQTSLAEKPRKCGLHRPKLLGRQESRQQSVTAEQVPHRQWLASLALASTKPTFEIHRPDLIGLARHAQARMPTDTSLARATAWPWRQLQALQPSADRPHAGNSPAASLKLSPYLLGTPVAMLLATTPDPLDPATLQPTRHSPRSSRPVSQRAASAFQKAVSPLVDRLAADTPQTTANPNRLLVPEQSPHQTPPLPNYIRDLPRHDRSRPLLLQEKCHPCLVPKLSPMCWHHALLQIRAAVQGRRSGGMLG
jgi:hypothetical protein